MLSRAFRAGDFCHFFALFDVFDLINFGILRKVGYATRWGRAGLRVVAGLSTVPEAPQAEQLSV